MHGKGSQEAVSRRGFLGALGAGAAIAPAAVCTMGVANAQSAPVIREDRFGRMFPTLPPFKAPDARLTAALNEIGRPGGLMDARDPLERGPIELITVPELSANNPDNPNQTAGVTFLGQFIDHDVTFDLNSTLGTPNRPEDIPNSRAPALDLDSVYGGGPTRSPQLYGRRTTANPMGGVKLRVESSGLFEDLPRNPDGTAIIGDPRNDEHIILAGLHCAFLLFHNNVVDRVAALNRTWSPEQVFAESQRLTRWHYQWIIVNEFLPAIIGRTLVNDILTRGRRFYTPPVGFMPVEFQGAAYRMGHSQVRPSYRANLLGDNGGPFFGFIFDPASEGQADPDDFRGGSRAARRFIGWGTFFNFNDGNVRQNKRLDTKISTPLFRLPLSAIATRSGPISLAQRNLLRHITWSMPSGQAIARVMGVPWVPVGNLMDIAPFGLGLENSTPLWFYILREAEVMAQGLTLGPVGGRIVGEVLIGLMQLNTNSYLRARPNWRPELPNRTGGVGTFNILDFLDFAGVSPAKRGQ